MTDMELIIRMFEARGIKFEVEGGMSLSVHDGYQGFVTYFDFDEKEQLKRVHAYE